MIEFLMDFLGVDWQWTASSYNNYNTLYQMAVEGAIVIAVVFICWFLSTISRSFFRG